MNQQIETHASKAMNPIPPPIGLKSGGDPAGLGFDLRHLTYHGWEVRSRLAHPSPEGTLSAGAEVFMDEICMCHLVSCMQFATASAALIAIERKATLWIDDRESNPWSNRVSALPLP